MRESVSAVSGISVPKQQHGTPLQVLRMVDDARVGMTKCLTLQGQPDITDAAARNRWAQTVASGGVKAAEYLKLQKLGADVSLLGMAAVEHSNEQGPVATPRLIATQAPQFLEVIQQTDRALVTPVLAYLSAANKAGSIQAAMNTNAYGKLVTERSGLPAGAARDQLAKEANKTIGTAMKFIDVACRPQTSPFRHEKSPFPGETLSPSQIASRLLGKAEHRFLQETFYKHLGDAEAQVVTQMWNALIQPPLQPGEKALVDIRDEAQRLAFVIDIAMARFEMLQKQTPPVFQPLLVAATQVAESYGANLGLLK